MNTERNNEKGNKADQGCCGFEGSRMSAMMNACCGDQNGSAGCSTMMKGMMEKMNKQSCCSPTSKNPGQEEGKP